jgi:hypothetical protein
MTKTTDSRYPYTYSCDLIRRAGPIRAGEGVILSRSDASQIMQLIASAIGMDERELACKLADVQIEHENNPNAVQKDVDRLIQSLGITN